MLQVNQLSMYHLKDLKVIIEDLSFVVNVGDKLAIIGEEGNGKSTLLKWLNNDSSIESYIQISGDYVNQFSRTAYLPQSMPFDEQQLSVENYLFRQNPQDYLDYNLIFQFASQLNFPTDKMYSKQLIKSLSGGEKIKLQLLKLLSNEPNLLLLDEPSNDLDLEAIEWLEHFIQQSPLPIIYISHDTELLKNTANRIIHLELLRHKTEARATVSNVSYATYVENRQTKFDRQGQLAANQRLEHRRKMEKYQQIEQSVHSQQNSISRQDPSGGRLLKKKMHAVKSMGRRFEREAEDFEEIPIQEDAIFVSFSNTIPLPNNKVILNWHKVAIKGQEELLIPKVNLEFKSSDKIGIIGKNGIGKSTLLKQINEELSGRADIKVGYFPQNYGELLSEDHTPLSFLQTNGSQEEKTQIMTYLGSMRFTADEMQHSISELSGGQQAKLILLKFDLGGHNVLLLDEPTRNFSPLSQPQIHDLLSSFSGAILTISHDRAYLKAVCNQILELTAEGLIPTELSF